MFCTMVILAALSILYTYTCSAPSLVPEGQKWGSNMFSPALTLPVLPRQQSEKNWGWVLAQHNSTHNYIHQSPATKEAGSDQAPIIFFYSHYHCHDLYSKFDAPGITDLSNHGSAINLIYNEDKANAFIAKIQAKQTFSLFAPPGPRPSCTRDCYGKGTQRPRSRLIWRRPRRTRRSRKQSKSKQLPLVRPILSSRNVRNWRLRHARQRQGLMPCASSWRHQLHRQKGLLPMPSRRVKALNGPQL